MLTEVCVIGAGIAGTTTALLLAQEGREVILLDAAEPGGGETSRTSAHLSSVIDDRFHNLIRWHGIENARRAAHSHAAAIGQIEALVADLDIECDFLRVDGYLFESGHSAPNALEQEFAAVRELDLEATLIEDGDGPAGVELARALRFPRQAQISPLAYLAGLRRRLRLHDGRVYGGTRIVEIREGLDAVVRAENGSLIRARHVVVATNTPVNNRFALHTKQAPYRSYVIALRVPRGAIEPALYWDLEDPYHYARLLPETTTDELLLVGGEDHKTGQAHDAGERFARLESWARATFPAAGAITHRWSGQVLETVDGLAFIGRNPGSPDNIYVATGDSGMGLTHGTIAGMLLTDLIQDRENPWEKLYSPGRITLPAAGTFARENANVARQYFKYGHADAADDTAAILPGTGRVIQRGLHKVAACRDESGGLHEHSAVCPHLGCVVSWNDVEHTWDCPCHGSRFTADGHVICGPATSPLAPAHSSSTPAAAVLAEAPAVPPI